MIAIIDGYNVIHRVPELRKRLDGGLEEAREGLIRCCGEWIASRGDVNEFWIVFDGRDPGAGNSIGARGVRVYFSRGGQSADDMIVETMQEVARYSRYVVVTDDNEIIRKIRALGSRTMPAKEFFATAKRRIVKGRSGPGDNAGQKPELGPDVEKRITESLKREWGIE